ncbi:MAG: c-type cytochrome biogenesis protein CcmI [Gammaproteobacteria bacterium]|nr:c-type cytochrome biogenesis protein CcmI [Gammaproteobacteria bacterium]
MIFWIVAAALLALALAILLIPLLRGSRKQLADQRQQQNIQIGREKKKLLDAQLAEGEIDQTVFDAAYLDLQTALALELERGEAQDQDARGSWMALVVLLAIPCASIALYMVYGEYRIIDSPQLTQAPAPQSQAPAPQMSLDEMVTAIEKRLGENPDDAEAWFMLGRTHMAKQEFDAAVNAYRRSDTLMADDPGILFALADALAMQNNGSMLGEPETLVLRGLQRAPRFPNGLWLAGMAAEQRQDFSKAHHYWSLLLPMITDDAAAANEVRGLLASLEQRDPGLVKAAGDKRQLTLHIDINDALRAQASAETAVFVYARAMQGPPMPLAVKRLQLQDLPLTLSLGDDDAMIPSMKLSSFDQVVVGARVSFSGNPVSQSGDFYTELESVDSTNPPEQIDLTIDQVK